MEKKMETTILGYRGTTLRIHSWIPSSSKVSLGLMGIFRDVPPGSSPDVPARIPKSKLPGAGPAQRLSRGLT